MKKYLIIALAALGFAACEKTAEEGNVQQNGEMEQSYVAVSLLADDMSTRAQGDEYEVGEPEERVVNSLYFFLFDAEGNAFNIDGGVNYKAVNVNAEGSNPGATAPDGTPNVSDVKDKVLVFKNYKGEYPAKMVAVINWAPATGAGSFSLDALAEQLIEVKNTTGFVMSNAVYAAESTNASAQKEAVRATPLTPANIAKNEADAKANPVKIYVERIAAKVTVNTTTENKYDIQETVDGKQIYAQVLGWELYNEFEKSYLLKDITASWTDTTVGFSWNDAAWFRSYWANSPTANFGDDNKVSYNTLSNDVATSDYCGENTYNDACTKVVVKAQLVEEVNGNLQPIEIATWFGNDYINEAALRTVVANTLASQLYYLEGTDYKSIEPEHLKVVEANETNPNTQAQAELKAYHVFFQLSNDGVAKEWYTYSSVEGFKVATDDAVNVILGGVEPALLYRGGQTYYYTNIKHLPSTVDATQYGVVRNHVYKVNINNIKGFGTPVYDGNTYFDPETPEDIETFISAEVRILSWRVVEHGYDLGE